MTSKIPVKNNLEIDIGNLLDNSTCECGSVLTWMEETIYESPPNMYYYSRCTKCKKSWEAWPTMLVVTINEQDPEGE